MKTTLLAIGFVVFSVLSAPGYATQVTAETKVHLEHRLRDFESKDNSIFAVSTANPPVIGSGQIICKDYSSKLVVDFYDLNTLEKMGGFTKDSESEETSGFLQASPDGTYFVAATNRNYIIIESRAPFKPLFEGYLMGITAIRVSNDSSKVYIGTVSGELYEINSRNGKKRILSLSVEGVRNLYSKEEITFIIETQEKLIAGWDGNIITIWDKKDMYDPRVLDLEPGVDLRSSTPIRSIIVDEDLNRMAFLSDYGLYLYNFKTLELIKRVKVDKKTQLGPYNEKTHRFYGFVHNYTSFLNDVTVWNLEDLSNQGIYRPVPEMQFLSPKNVFFFGDESREIWAMANQRYYPYEGKLLEINYRGDASN